MGKKNDGENIGNISLRMGLMNYSNSKINKKVLLLMAQGFEEYEASAFTDVLGWSRVMVSNR